MEESTLITITMVLIPAWLIYLFVFDIRKREYSVIKHGYDWKKPPSRLDKITLFASSSTIWVGVGAMIYCII